MLGSANEIWFGRALPRGRSSDGLGGRLLPSGRSSAGSGGRLLPSGRSSAAFGGRLLPSGRSSAAFDRVAGSAGDTSRVGWRLVLLPKICEAVRSNGPGLRCDLVDGSLDVSAPALLPDLPELRSDAKTCLVKERTSGPFLGMAATTSAASRRSSALACACNRRKSQSFRRRSPRAILLVAWSGRSRGLPRPKSRAGTSASHRCSLKKLQGVANGSQGEPE